MHQSPHRVFSSHSSPRGFQNPKSNRVAIVLIPTFLILCSKILTSPVQVRMPFASRHSSTAHTSHHFSSVRVSLRTKRARLSVYYACTHPCFSHRICIARLYGGGPSLFISPALIATPKYPLTPGFPTSTSLLEPLVISQCPPDQHPASPRFLLSLLATSLFLSIPSVASQALTSILKTVGPTTAVRYLNFAIGKGIGEAESEEPEAAVGLEGVAELLKDDEEESIAESSATPIETPRALTSEELSEKLKGLSMEFDRIAERDISRTGHLDIKKEDPSDLASESSRVLEHTYSPHASEPTLFYGGVSDKIGEAAACWLARWGVDMLRREQQEVSAYAEASGSESRIMSSNKDIVSPTPRRSSVTRKRATTIPSDGLASRPTAFSPQTMKTVQESVPVSIQTQTPVIWRRGGLDARWVRGVLSSDWLFVAGEKERYDMARSVADMHRAEGLVPEEEAEFEQLFGQGIYYANMVRP